MEDFQDASALVVMFICNHCPFVKHVRDELVRIAGDYRDKGVAVVAVNSNDWSAYPDDSPEMMEKEAREHQKGLRDPGKPQKDARETQKRPRDTEEGPRGARERRRSIRKNKGSHREARERPRGP